MQGPTLKGIKLPFLLNREYIYRIKKKHEQKESISYISFSLGIGLIIIKKNKKTN